MERTELFLKTLIFASFVLINCTGNYSKDKVPERDSRAPTPENITEQGAINRIKIERIHVENDIINSVAEIRTIIFKGYRIDNYPLLDFQILSNGYLESYGIFSSEKYLNKTAGIPILLYDSINFVYVTNPEYLNKSFIVETINDSIMITWLSGEVTRTSSSFVKSLYLDTTKSKVMTMIFKKYGEGDLRHMIFQDIITGTLHDFRFYSKDLNELSGIPVLLDDDTSPFGYKANPEYINKTFILEVKVDSVRDYDFGDWDKIIKKKVWVITSLKLK